VGTHDQVTVANRSGAASSQLQEITTADGPKLDSQLSQLVQAMATYGAANPGFDPTVATQASKAPALQNTLAAAWHH
jgi:serralysin